MSQTHRALLNVLLNNLLQNLTVKLGRQDFESALPMLQKAVDQGLQDPLAWETLAFIHYSQGRMEEALTAYRKAYALDPANPRFRQNLYALLFTMGRTDEAAAFAP